MNDLGYISHPDSWHTWPLCPLKRRSADGRGNDTAYLADGHGPTLHYGNIFDPKEMDRKEVFPSFDAILAAGWQVD